VASEAAGGREEPACERGRTRPDDQLHGGDGEERPDVVAHRLDRELRDERRVELTVRIGVNTQER
jgi:hypothetical protein